LAEFVSPRPVLRLLARSLDTSLVMLVHSLGDRAKVEDAWPPSIAAGQVIRMPSGVVTNTPATLKTEAIRLPLQWTEACGARPTWLTALPLVGNPLHLVVASCAAAAPDIDDLKETAVLVAQTLAVGGKTQRERDASRRIAALVNNLPVPLVFVDAETLEMFLNDRARALLRLPKGPQDNQEAIADALAGLMQGAIEDGQAAPRSALASHDRASFEIERESETYKVQTEWINSADLTGRVWLFTDISREKAFHLELRELTSLLQLTIENVSAGVALVDDQLRLMLWNEAYVELFGYPPDAVYPRADFLDLARITAERGELGGESVEAALEALRQSLRQRSERRFEMLRENGRVLDVTRKSLKGGQFILTARDKTDEHRAAQLKDELVSTVSHELRTPLTSIAGALTLLKTGMVGELPPSAINLIEIAHRNSDRLSRLINDLLDMDKLEVGEASFRFAPVDLRALVWEAVVQSEPYAARFGVTLELDAQEAPVTVEADADRLMQVMSNLISNAAKFSPAGSRVTVRLRTVESSAQISVIDRGRGISPEFRKRLFARFAQEAGPSERGQSGTGLGLAITKAIVERHGGTIELDPATEVGATFHIDLPLGKACA
jgi:signal transduction histidine kinase